MYGMEVLWRWPSKLQNVSSTTQNKREQHLSSASCIMTHTSIDCKPNHWYRKYMISKYTKWQVTDILSEKGKHGLSEDEENLNWFLNRIKTKPWVADCKKRFASHLLESCHCLQECWCNFGPGWRTQKRALKGCLLPPCSPSSHQSHQWQQRSSWRQYQAGSPWVQRPNQLRAASRPLSGQAASPAKISHLYTKRTFELNFVRLLCRCWFLASEQEFFSKSKAFFQRMNLIVLCYDNYSTIKTNKQNKKVDMLKSKLGTQCAWQFSEKNCLHSCEKFSVKGRNVSLTGMTTDYWYSPF